MIFQRKIGTKGQVVIPKDIRDMMGLSAGSTVIFEIKNGEIKIRKETPPSEFLEEFLQTPKKFSKKKNIKKLLGEQIEERI
jgi:AbrB family looped-hinge helix DNA binding protein